MAGADYDAIVIGGGHNGLVAAAYLARGGRRVLLVERRAELGGAASSLRSSDGLALEIGGQDLGLFRSEIARDLGLDLPLVRPEVSLLSLLADQPPLPLWREPDRAAAAIARLSSADASAYPRFAAQVRRHSQIVQQMLHRTPPDLPVSGRWNTLRAAAPWLGVLARVRGLGARSMIELLRSLPMDVARLLEEWFERPEVQGALASAGIVGRMQGPKSSGTALMLLYQSIGGFPRGSTFMRGGVQRFIEALSKAARRLGVDIRTGTPVERILTGDYSAVGVRLASGEEIRATSVASSADPRHTMLDLVGAEQLELRVVRRLRNLRFRGSTARVNLVTDGLPTFRGVESPELLLGHVVVAPSLEYLERAYDAAKYGRTSAEPHLSLTIPTLHRQPDDGQGQQVLAVTVRYTPHRLSSGDWETQREPLGDRVVELLARHASDLPGRLIDRQVLTPADLESEFGLPEGSIHHGQMALDQLLFMRPIPGYAGYRSPVGGLYFCGAGAHPGGGLTGMPGRNAARLMLKDLGRR